MRKLTMIALLACSTSLFSFAPTTSSVWNFDNSHARVGFSVSHMTVSDVDGFFKDVKASITASKDDLSDAVADFTAQVASINTDNEKRDGHLQSADYFDAAKYPTITFKSTSFKKTKLANGYIISGNLNMHGVTKPISMAAIIKMGVNPMSKKTVAGFKVTGKLKRKDFGIGMDTPEAMLGNDINININAEFVKE